jgi:RNA polymerase sigma-70 factor (ECF subfamily)
MAGWAAVTSSMRWSTGVEDRRVIAAMRRRQPDQRDVLLVRILSGLTMPEVAVVLGTTTGAVKALQHRGLASVARMLTLQDTE